MFVITANRGDSFRNDRSLSSASATRYLPRPSRALLPNELTRPPITAVGSRPATSSTSAIIDVVVVLPCAPATAMPWRSRISSASSSARGTTARPRSRAADDLRVRRPHGGRIHDDLGVADVARVVPLGDARAERLEPVGDVRALHVRSAHLVSEIHQQLGDAAHPDSTDADEMNALGLLQALRSRADRAAPPARDDGVDDLFGRARPAPAAGPPPTCCRRLSRSPASAMMRSASRSPVRSFCSITSAAPAASQRLARSGAGDRRSRSAAESESPAVPAAVTSASVVAPARETTSPAAFISRSIASMNRSTRPCTPLPLEGLANHVEVSRPRLADEIEGCGCGRQPRRRLHHGHVDCVRALRAAKDQDPNLVRRRCRRHHRPPGTPAEPGCR